MHGLYKCNSNRAHVVGISCCGTLAQYSTRWSLQIVTGTTPSTRGKLPTPNIPQDCPADIWELIQQCLVLNPNDRPSAKQVTQSCSSAAAALACVCGAEQDFYSTDMLASLHSLPKADICKHTDRS